MTADGAGAEAPRVIAIFGPTGIGKTAVAIALGEELRARGADPLAISADALQVYEGLGTLTGAATEEEQARLEHRLVGVVPVAETFSAGAFAERAHAEIDAALAAGRSPVVVGGTGLYLQAALCELDLRPPPPPALRAALSERVEREGAAALHAELAERDPDAAAAIATTDRTRVIRALELLEQGESPPTTGDASRLWTAATRHSTVLVGLTLDRGRLYEQIDARCEQIVAGGCPCRGPSGGRRRRVADGAQGARLRGAARRRYRGDEAPHAQLREAPARVDAKARRGHADSHGRSHGRRGGRGDHPRRPR